MTYRDGNGKPNWAVVVITVLQVVVTAVVGYMMFRIDSNSVILSDIRVQVTQAQSELSIVKDFVKDHDERTDKVAAKVAKQHHSSPTNCLECKGN